MHNQSPRTRLGIRVVGGDFRRGYGNIQILPHKDELLIALMLPGTDGKPTPVELSGAKIERLSDRVGFGSWKRRALGICPGIAAVLFPLFHPIPIPAFPSFRVHPVFYIIPANFYLAGAALGLSVQRLIKFLITLESGESAVVLGSEPSYQFLRGVIEGPNIRPMT